MTATATDAFSALYSRLAPGERDLVSDDIHASVFEAFNDLRAAAHPDLIAEIEGQDYVGRGLMAHALFLSWRDRREGDFLLERVREHMMGQLREAKTPLPHIYRLGEALTRFCESWKTVENKGT